MLRLRMLVHQTRRGINWIFILNHFSSFLTIIMVCSCYIEFLTIDVREEGGGVTFDRSTSFGEIIVLRENICR